MLTQKKITIPIKKTRLIVTKLSPNNATKQELTWTTSNDSIVKITNIKKYLNDGMEVATLKALAPGEAIIKASAKEFGTWGGFSIFDTTKVTVPNPLIYISPEFRDKGPGALNYGMEQDRMEPLAEELHNYLQSKGYNSIIGCETSGKDKIHAYERTDESNAFGADFHIALHSNSFDGTASGPFTIYSRVGTYAHPNSNTLPNKFKTITSNQSEMSKNLSQKIQDNLFNLYCQTEEFNDAVKRAVNNEPHYQFTEVTAVDAVASYVEVAFHDNPLDAKWIIDNMGEIAKAIGEAIIDYILETT